MNHNTYKLVSIGMPVYNGALYLREALDSLLRQSCSNWELIISDNVSIDETEKICTSYANQDSRIQYIRQSHHISLGQNYNAVLRASKGFYFMWAAHDDIWHPRFLEKCVQKLENNPQVGMVFCNYVFIDEQGVIIKKLDPKQFFPFASTHYERTKQYLLLPHHEGKANLIYGLWRREFLLRVPAFAYKNYWISWGSDANFIFRALLEGGFSFIDKTLFFKRVKPLPRSSIRQFPLKFLYPFFILLTPHFFTYILDILRSRQLKVTEKVRLIVSISI
jgi:glycosyltransferase involved in cell wall biosynthesis